MRTNNDRRKKKLTAAPLITDSITPAICAIPLALSDIPDIFIAIIPGIPAYPAG
ncbi:hypothetical protein [Erwinia piriflorinigrans]|uniref:hypothetical protein n=1 Tax=Erwinia piriflorinigrans TaxID=665097 RepID=UPI0012EE7132|nr:hypothetical protein [Erwinia piriflorinigrans]